MLFTLDMSNLKLLLYYVSNLLICSRFKKQARMALDTHFSN
ncbi:hypothetical protein HanIR_Chr16g0794401 [Helianthus annuus]|nr:hypothetical protein HanIR_Chr16g0794401 [Helianthus annuus]